MKRSMRRVTGLRIGALAACAIALMACTRVLSGNSSVGIDNLQAELASPWLDQASLNVVDTGKATQPEALVCFVVRTYWGHGKQFGDQSLLRLLESLKAQTYTRWEALLLVLDNRPFPDLQQIVHQQEDDRVWIFAEWVSYKYDPKSSDGTWASQYHKLLYNLTDNAIRACPQDTEWVVVTNGDNQYDPQFVATLVDGQSTGYDAVAFDFYSRYQRPTAPPCHRFSSSSAEARTGVSLNGPLLQDDSDEQAESAGDGGSSLPPGDAANAVAGAAGTTTAGTAGATTVLPACKVNRMRLCHTDLAAVGYRWPKLLSEGRLFGTVDPGDGSSADGRMAAKVVEEGWKVRYVHDRCLVHHSPNAQMCAAMGGVWDDTAMWRQNSFGGSCISLDRAKQMLTSDPAAFEVMAVNITFDRHSFNFRGTEVLPLTCLRQVDRRQWWGPHVFGTTCVDDLDADALPGQLARLKGEA